MVRRFPYRESVHKVLVNETTEYAEGSEVGSNRMLYVTAGALENQTHAPTTIAFGLKVNDEFIVMEEDDAPSSGITYSLKKTHSFRPGERPAWRVEGGTADDVLEGYIEGYVEMSS